jgi:opacity protein-like surface antigen
VKRTGLAVLAGILALPFAAETAPSRYFIFGAAVDFPGEETDVPVYFEDAAVQTETNAGFNVSFGGGFRPRQNVRLEGEVGYRSSKIDDVKVLYINTVGMGIEGGKGDITGLSFMANGWYDLYNGQSWSPYFGGGIGAAQVSLNDFLIVTYPIVPNPPMTERVLVDDKAWQFAYQVGAGLGYELKESIVIDLSYRYFATLDPKFTDAGGNELEANYSHHNVQIAITYGL